MNTPRTLTVWCSSCLPGRPCFACEPDDNAPPALPIHRTEAGYPNCATCDGGGCYDCTDPA